MNEENRAIGLSVRKERIGSLSYLRKQNEVVLDNPRHIATPLDFVVEPKITQKHFRDQAILSPHGKSPAGGRDMTGEVPLAV